MVWSKENWQAFFIGGILFIILGIILNLTINPSLTQIEKAETNDYGCYILDNLVVCPSETGGQRLTAFICESPTNCQGRESKYKIFWTGDEWTNPLTKGDEIEIRYVLGGLEIKRVGLKYFNINSIF